MCDKKLKKLRNYKAIIKELDILVDVFKIDFKNKNVVWYDNQWSRTDPPHKEFEVSHFDEIKLYKKEPQTDCWRSVF